MTMPTSPLWGLAVLSEACTVAQVENEQLRAALRDMWAGWRYIRRVHGDLSGVAWDRCEAAARIATGKDAPFL